MKKINLIFLFYFIYMGTYACSYIPESFCASSSYTMFSNDLIISGTIVSIGDKSIDIEIIDVLRGNENKSVIRVWNGKDFDCNGFFSMAASDLGNLNETIIVRLPKILEKTNEWDVVGDYTRPDYFGYITNLKLEDEKVKGFISGDANNENTNGETSYDSFKNSWKNNNDCSSIVLSIRDFAKSQNFKIESLQFNKFKVSSINSEKFLLNIYDLNGLRIKNKIQFIKEILVDLSIYSKGIYIFHITTEKRKSKVVKILNK